MCFCRASPAGASLNRGPGERDFIRAASPRPQYGAINEIVALFANASLAKLRGVFPRQGSLTSLSADNYLRCCDRIGGGMLLPKDKSESFSSLLIFH